MSTYLCVNVNNSIKRFTAKSTVDPTKPYIRVQDGYFPLTTETSTGTQIKIRLGTNNYRIVQSYTTTTEQQITTGTSYLTTESTYETTYGTSESTIATIYETTAFTYSISTGTAKVTYATSYLTGKSTTNTRYATKQGQMTWAEVLYTPAGNINRMSFTYVRNKTYGGTWGAEKISWDLINGRVNLYELNKNAGAVTIHSVATTITNSTAGGGKIFLFDFMTYLRLTSSITSQSAMQLTLSEICDTNFPPTGGLITDVYTYGWHVDYLGTSSNGDNITLTVHMNFAEGNETNYHYETLTTNTYYDTITATTSTSYLTKSVWGETSYLTMPMTVGTSYITRKSTSETGYLTRKSTYYTSYLTTTTSQQTQITD